jgi:hypothetical protein
MKSLQLSLVIVLAALLFIGCADPRQAPVAPGTPAYTKTVILWDDVVSAGTAQSASFVIDGTLSAATVTVAGFITPDNDIVHIEAIQEDSIPSKADQITGYLIGQEELSAEITDFLAALDTLDPNTEDSVLIALYQDSLDQDSVSWFAFGDSIAWAIADTTAMGERRDSLVLLVDDRFVLSVWSDVDAIERYPSAVYLDDQADTLSGQRFWAAATDTVTGMKGRSFQLNLREWSAADPANVGRPIVINWLSHLTAGEHSISVRLTGSGSRITGTIMLVYEEG